MSRFEWIIVGTCLIVIAICIGRIAAAITGAM